MAKAQQSAPKVKRARGGKAGDADGEHRGITEHEVEAVEEMSTPRTPVIYEVVRRQGDEELERPAVSLWWSGLAAGLSMSFSLLAQAALKTHLPDTPWRPLVTGLGYSVGFLMTILSRQQLFTESTITVVLPVLGHLKWHHFWRLIRLWSIVLVANLVGTFVAALFCNYSAALPHELLVGMHGIGRELLTLTWGDMFFRAISSGFLIAAMVWMIPTAENQQFVVITMMTWLISVGGFTHVVAGSMEAYLLVFAGDWAWWQLFADFLLPVLAGNIVGGTALFAVISYAQVMKEI
jgi:formate-nitrite transporter family protein